MLIKMCIYIFLFCFIYKLNLSNVTLRVPSTVPNRLLFCLYQYGQCKSVENEPLMDDCCHVE